MFLLECLQTQFKFAIVLLRQAIGSKHSRQKFVIQSAKNQL